jgi:preprotein translocase subunit YajC
MRDFPRRQCTAGGIIGTVNKLISDTEVSVEIAEGVRVRVIRTTITEVLSKTEPVAASKDDKGKDENSESETAEKSDK